MTVARLADLQTLDEVARACGVEAARITGFANEPSQAGLYTMLRIAKRSRHRRGTYRVVYKAGSKVLSNFHRSVAMIVVNSASFGESVQGFVKKRSTRTNAALHLGARRLLHADIRAFFDSISTEQVRDALIVAGSPPPIAGMLARACTIDGLLRQGTRCAPALANLVCQHLDADMLSLARATNTKYSRYADDITFSGDETPSSDAVAHILQKYGFELRDGRCQVQRRGRNQYVTGLTIADRQAPRLPRRLKRQLRLTFHYIEKNGVSAHEELSHLEGMLTYVHSIEPALATRWWKALATGRAKGRDDEHPETDPDPG